MKKNISCFVSFFKGLLNGFGGAKRHRIYKEKRPGAESKTADFAQEKCVCVGGGGGLP